MIRGSIHQVFHLLSPGVVWPPIRAGRAVSEFSRGVRLSQRGQDMGQFRACAVVVMVFVPWASSAQVTPPLTGRDMQSLRTAPPPPIAEVALPDLTDAEKSWLGACDTLYLTPPDSEFPADLAGAPNGYALIGACASDLAKKVTTLNEPDATMQNRALIRIRVNYKTLQRWVGFGRGTATGSGRETALKAVRDLDEVLADALKARKLFAQFSATLMTGPSFHGHQEGRQGRRQDQDPRARCRALGNTALWRCVAGAA